MLEIRQFPINSPWKSVSRIASRYARAIVRRNREATDPDFLAYVWREHSSHFVRQGKNFLILRKLGPVYVATHFAPNTLKGGYRLLLSVLASKLPVVFTVPEDLAANLERIGWKRLPRWITNKAIEKGLPEDKVILTPPCIGLATVGKIALQGFDFKKEETKSVYSVEPRQRKRKHLSFTARLVKSNNERIRQANNPFCSL